ncbi:hypothetical protein LTR62_002516 [Meristemomyces frigidus]|uniref:Uncharacterized protein n=1 Tax=Meristemomyces frigidus TaxID=1508187 RepID=A0AAN7TJD0_9PEZI|nr:hypothetical protein LTR62_002516 [Meristemomyces frigidus]
MGVQDTSASSSRAPAPVYRSHIECEYGRHHASNATVRPHNTTKPKPSYQRHEPKAGKSKAPTTASTKVIDLTGDSPPKRKQKSKPLDDDDEEAPDAKKAKRPKDEEKRLKRWRKQAPTTYLEVRNRALTQRMFALDRQRDTSNPGHPTETISLAGTTGNVYTIVVDKVPSCDCPHARKGNQCKHIAYVLSRVLRVPANLEYQLAFISSELREIFVNAPPLPSETADNNDDKDGKRKPIEGECPICCVDFEPESGEVIVYCKAACGNNIHGDCFKQWAATKTGRGAVTCPFCRTAWEREDGEAAAKDVVRDGARNRDGYVNVAQQLGMSGRRDYSTYHSYWVRAQARNGEIE